VEAAQLYAYATRLSRLTRLGEFLTGELDFTAALSGDLTDSLALVLDTFASNGVLQTRAASISGHPLQTALASFLAAPELGQLAISDWLQPFRIANGRVTLDGMSLKAGEVELSARGWLAMDSSIELALDVLLPQAMSNGVRAKVPPELLPLLFDGSDTRVLLPLAIGGKLPEPRISLDLEKLRAGAQRRAETLLTQERDRLKQEAQRQAGEFLRGLAEGDADSTAKQAESQNDDVRQEVDDLLKKLLRRK
jgi:hypothetical protein